MTFAKNFNHQKTKGFHEFVRVETLRELRRPHPDMVKAYDKIIAEGRRTGVEESLIEQFEAARQKTLDLQNLKLNIKKLRGRNVSKLGP